MLEILNKLLDEKTFKNIDYPTIVGILKTDKYINTLIRNFLYLLDIKIPDEFMIYISDDTTFSKQILETSGPKYQELKYFAEAPMLLSLQEYFNQYCYLNFNKKSPLLYHINIINYSIFCVKNKTKINPLILNELLQSIIDCLTTYNYTDILQLYKKYVSFYFILQEDERLEDFPIFKGGSSKSTMDMWFDQTRNNFLYFSFNQINQVKLSYFQFTNIIFATIDIEKPSHYVIAPLFGLISHDLNSHTQITRTTQITDFESYRLFKFLLFINENKYYKDLSYSPWLFFHEYRDRGLGGSDRVFNLFDLPNNIINSLRPDDFTYTFKCAIKLLYFLDKSNIVSLNKNIKEIIKEYKDKTELSLPERVALRTRMGNRDCKPMYRINDYIWKLRLKEQVNDQLCDEELFIEDLLHGSFMNMDCLINEFRKECSDNALKTYNYPDNRKNEFKISEDFIIHDYHRKYLTYKNKYLNLKHSLKKN